MSELLGNKQGSSQAGCTGSAHGIGVVLEVLQRSATEEAKARGVIVAAVDAADPERATCRLEEGGGNALNLPLPHLGLHVGEEEVLHHDQLAHLQKPRTASFIHWLLVQHDNLYFMPAVASKRVAAAATPLARYLF